MWRTDRRQARARGMLEGLQMHILERSPRLHMRIFSRLLLLFVLGLQIPSACLAQPAADPLTAQNVLNAIR
ncbi:MAG: hypothetical protein R3C12_11425 [Planctomycetaceae bacterium]